MRSWDDEEYAADHLLRYFTDKIYELGKAFGSLQHENADLKKARDRAEYDAAVLTANIATEAEFHTALEKLA